jgi:predicted kinase
LTRFQEKYIINKGEKMLYLTVSPSGSGKTRWAKEFVRNNKGIVRVCPDDIRKEITGNISDQTQNALVWKTAKNKVKMLLENFNVVLDATNVKNKERNDLIKFIQPDKITYVIFKDIDEKICKERIKKDITDGLDRSKVPDDVIETMFANYKISLDYIRKNVDNITSFIMEV